jgi:hypothetical protein
VKRLTDEQLEALFCGHWEKTHDLLASLRLVIDADRLGRPQAVARAGAQLRHTQRPVVISRLVDRAKIVQIAQPIIERFARESGMPVRQLFARRGSRTIVKKRDEAMLVIRRLTDMSYPEIGLAFGGRSHSDARAGVMRAEARIATDDVARARLLAFVAPTKRRAA